MKRPNIIHEFDPVLYPVKLWVSITEDAEYLRSNFILYPSRKKLSLKVRKDADACVDTVMSLETNDIGILITFRNLKACTMGVIAHEATHASCRIWKRISEREYGSEANAYLIEWIVKCCEKVKLNKI